ncbi:MAG: hypothetical protein E7544_03565 [Ruminococcaceae bacterium]|nr:hypothetical protein [Oscillospiraceae bacterium]
MNKKKLKAKRPPLSHADSFIYILILFSAFFLIFGLSFLLYVVIPKHIAYSDSSIIASQTDDKAIFCFLPITLLLSQTLILMGSAGLKRRQPIFGNKKFKPRMFEPVLKVYPLFSRDFKKNLAEEQKEKIKKTVVFVSVLLIISLIIMPLGFSPRDTLDNENILKTYNSFNRVTHSVNVENAEKLVIKIYKAHKSYTYHIELTFIDGNHKYVFYEHSFDNLSSEETLKHIDEIKEVFNNGKYELLNTNRVDSLIESKNYSPTEKALVYKIFDLI